VLQRGGTYDEVYSSFRWELPERFNIGIAACDRHADGGGRLALVYQAPDGKIERFTFDDMKRLSNKCANALAALGVGAGDRVASVYRLVFAYIASRSEPLSRLEISRHALEARGEIQKITLDVWERRLACQLPELVGSLAVQLGCRLIHVAHCAHPANNDVQMAQQHPFRAVPNP
jgi:hypothetical protein